MSTSAKTPIETLQTAWKAYLDTKLVKAILAYDAAMKLSDDSAKEAAVTDATTAMADAGAAKLADTAVESAITTTGTDVENAITSAIVDVKAVATAVSSSGDIQAAMTKAAASVTAVDVAATSSSPAAAVSNKEVEKDDGLLKAWDAFIGTDLVIAIKKNKLEMDDKEKKKAILAAETAISKLKEENDVMKKTMLNATVVSVVNSAVDAVQSIITAVKSFFFAIGKDDKIKKLIDKAKTEIDKVSRDLSSLSVDKTGAVVSTEAEVAKTTGVKTPVTTLYITSKGGNFSVSENKPSTTESNVFKMNLTGNCWTRDTTSKGGAMTKKRMRTTKRQLKGKRGLKSRVKSRVKTSRS